MKGRTLALFLLIALALLSGVPLLVRAAYVALALVPLSYLWAELNTRRLEAHAEPGAERCQVGQYYQEQVTLRNRGLLPKALLEVRSSPGLPGPGEGRLVSLPPGGLRSWRARIKCQLRGLYPVGTVAVASVDPWGLFSRRRVLGRPRSLLVYPATLELPRFLLPTQEARGEGQGRRLAPPAPPSASGLRDYIPGDSFSRIHWPTTVRTGKLMVKEFKGQPSGEVWIVPDLCQAEQAGSGPESTEEYAITLAASIARQHLEADYSVGLLAQGDKRLLLSPQPGRHNLWPALEALALVQARGKTPLAQLLAEEAGRFSHRSLLVLIAPAQGPLEAALSRHILPRRAGVVAIVLDSATFGGREGSRDTARRLSQAGFRTYLVRRGDDLARALDSPLAAQARLSVPQGEGRAVLG